MQTARDFFREFYRIWIAERPAQQAAALAYYSMFSFAPVIFVAYTIAGLFVAELRLSDPQFVRLESLLGPEVTQVIYDALAGLESTTSSSSLFLSVIGFLALLFAASGLFYQLQFALNRVWQVPVPEKGETRTLVRQRLFAFLLVIGLGVLLALATLLNVALSFLDDLLLPGRDFQLPSALLYILAVTAIFLLLYKILPERKISWRDLWLGAFLAALLLTLGGYLVGLYLGSSRASSALEAAGAVAILLSAFYYFAQVFILGAVFSRVYASLSGSLKG
jgi:membrane protein